MTEWGRETWSVEQRQEKGDMLSEIVPDRIFLWYNDTQTTMHLIPLKSSVPVIPVSLPTLTFFLYISLAIQKIILFFPHLFFFFLMKQENEQPSPKSVLLNHFVPCSIFFFPCKKSEYCIWSREICIGRNLTILGCCYWGKLIFSCVT